MPRENEDAVGGEHAEDVERNLSDPDGFVDQVNTGDLLRELLRGTCFGRNYRAPMASSNSAFGFGLAERE